MSLILLDELGATCAPTKSLPYMWSIAESLLAEDKTITLLVTHNQWVKHLSDVYPCSVAWTVYKFHLITN